ncbi:MAG TPA: 3-dehydroquinate synthase family protein [bacterium]|jgi:3-dehydroquinate synthase|nr:3-dehydroquinate synthase family protein [bacterium]
MSTVQVRLREVRSSGYPVHVEPGLIHRAGGLLRARFAGHAVFAVSNPQVFGLWGRALEASLKRGGFGRPLWHLVPDGERHKSFPQYHKILSALAAWDRGLAAKPLVLLLGGGVIGDLGGFAAATYKRGVPFVQLPTTLLSMVDSSVGGKLGLDFDTPAGRVKNLVGCFAQPEAVLADPGTLATLAPRQLLGGLAELVKTAVLFDAPLFAKLEKNRARLLQADAAFYSPLISSSVAHKASVVARDEFDRKGLRVLLNLGHTFGHAVESASGFRLLHGEAVAFGMACAGDLASREGLLTSQGEADRARLNALLESLGFRLRLKGLALPAVLAALARDKKFEGGARFVLPRRLGICVTHPLKSLAPAQAVLTARLR